jgi:hypothetical protein
MWEPENENENEDDKMTEEQSNQDPGRCPNDGAKLVRADD